MATLPELPHQDKAPDWGLVDDGDFVLDEVQFGDGFMSRSPKGINSIRRRWEVNWSLLSREEAHAIRDFLLSLKGSDPFLWTHPDSNEKIEIVSKFPRLTHTDYDNYEVSATFEENF